MQGLLKQHEQQIREALEESARNILRGIIEDPSYHTINQMYFNTVLNNGEKVVNQVRDDGQSVMSQIRHNASNVENDIRQNVAKELQSIGQLKQHVKTLEKTIDSQSFWQTVSFIGWLGVASAVGYLYFTRK